MKEKGRKIMNMIEKIRDKIRNLGADSAKRESELDKLRADLAALDEKRTKAIDADNYKLVEDLTRERAEILLKIEAKEAINTRKNEQGVARAEIAEAWADDCSDYQKQIDKARKEIHSLMRQAAEKTLVMADAINSAWEARVAALRLANDQEPTTFNAGNSDFAGTNFKTSEILKIADFFTAEEWQQLRPDALAAIRTATRDKANHHFHLN